MDLREATELIKKLYKKNITSDIDWNYAISNFKKSLDKENNVDVLEQCILDDLNWELHVEGRIALLHKAKCYGASSKKFLIDYYGYLSAHLDPSEEQRCAETELSKLLEKER